MTPTTEQSLDRARHLASAMKLLKPMGLWPVQWTKNPKALRRRIEVLEEELRLTEDKLREETYEKQEEPCSGPGYAHKPHGNCPGYATDRT